MFDIQFRFLLKGSSVAFEGFVDSILAEVTRRVRVENHNLPRVRPVVQEVPWRAHEEERKGPKRLAVGINEAAKMLGISSRTLWLYVSERKIRAVRIGRWSLVPMEVLDKVMVEGVERGRS